MPKVSLPRVLALDLREHQYGYAIFEGPHLLLLWGLRQRSSLTGRRLRRHVSMLRSTFGFTSIVGRIRLRDRTPQAVTSRVAKAIIQFAQSASVQLILIKAAEIRAHFGGMPKSSINRFVAGRFPELAWRLPPHRKLWHSERRRQLIFDSVAVGIYFFDRLQSEEYAVPSVAS